MNFQEVLYDAGDGIWWKFFVYRLEFRGLW